MSCCCCCCFATATTTTTSYHQLLLLTSILNRSPPSHLWFISFFPVCNFAESFGIYGVDEKVATTYGDTRASE